MWHLFKKKIDNFSLALGQVARFVCKLPLHLHTEPLYQQIEQCTFTNYTYFNKHNYNSLNSEIFVSRSSHLIKLFLKNLRTL